LLVLALLAQIAGAVFLYLDYSQYGTTDPPRVQIRPAVTTQQATPPNQDPNQVNPPVDPNNGMNPMGKMP
jgi:hypothetical protein